MDRLMTPFDAACHESYLRDESASEVGGMDRPSILAGGGVRDSGSGPGKENIRHRPGRRYRHHRRGGAYGRHCDEYRAADPGSLPVHG